MSSTNTASDELRDILTEYCNENRNIPDIESVRTLVTKVSVALRYKLLVSITHSNGDTVLRGAAYRGHTEVCVTLLSSLPPADRLKLIIANKHAALHSAAYWGYTDTVSGILNCLTAEQQLQLLFTQSGDGDTAFHYAALGEPTEIVKTLLDYLTPEQQLKLLSVQNYMGMTASQRATGVSGNKNTKKNIGTIPNSCRLSIYYRFSILKIERSLSSE